VPPTLLDWHGEVTTKGTVSANSRQEFASATFGYAISVTPMHMAIAYSAIANDGVLMHPILVKQIVTNDGNIIKDNPIRAERTVLRSSTARSLRTALIRVTDPEHGTAKLARVPGFHVAGKTGTSRKWDNGYKAGRVICSFGGMMPAHDPKLVCYIVVDEPQTTTVNRYGGTLAAPIFSQIARRAAQHMNLIPGP